MNVFFLNAPTVILLTLLFTLVNLRPPFSHRLALHVQTVRVVHQPIQDRICQRVVAYASIPLIRWQLAYYHRRGFAVAIVHQLQQVVSLSASQRLKTPVVQDQQLRLRQHRQLLLVAPVRTALHQLREQTAQSPVLDAEPLLAGVVPQRASHVGFPAAAGARYQQVLPFRYPLVLAELGDPGPVQVASGLIVDIVHRRLQS